MTDHSISRRNFLKAGCFTAAAAGLTVCGASAIMPLPEETAIELPSFSYGEKRMGTRILVAYSSALGSTAEVAAEIGKTLAVNGVAVDVVPMIDEPRLDDYQAVLIGSAVHHGHWLPEAVAFVHSGREALNRVPVGLFTVHISNQGDDVESRDKRLAYLDEVRPLLEAVDEVFFAGKFDRRGAALLMPGWLARLVPTLDMRKWERIRAWAESVRPKLLARSTTNHLF